MSDAERLYPDLVIRTRGHVTVVRLKVENLTNVHDVNRIQHELGGLIDSGHTRLVLDLKNVKYAGSAALGMLLAIAQRMTTRQGRLVLSHPETVAELLRISKTERMFTTAPDPKSAIALLE